MCEDRSALREGVRYASGGTDSRTEQEALAVVRRVGLESSFQAERGPNMNERQYWHVTRAGRVRRCFAMDSTKHEGRLLAAGCEGDSKMGCEIHPVGCPYAGYACGISTEEEAREVAKAYRV